MSSGYYFCWCSQWTGNIFQSICTAHFVWWPSCMESNTSNKYILKILLYIWHACLFNSIHFNKCSFKKSTRIINVRLFIIWSSLLRIRWGIIKLSSVSAQGETARVKRIAFSRPKALIQFLHKIFLWKHY